ncbi:MAG: sigma-70 family RNA polymerase sigma factor [Pirellula sp.]
MSEITQILLNMNQDGQLATNQLLPLVYDELKRLAARKLAIEQPGHTLQTTALVHEAYVRLVGDDKPAWENRVHFFAAAAEAMRRILVDSARSKQRLKRGGDWNRVDLDSIEAQLPEAHVDILALDEALNELSKEHPQKAELVRLRFFAGLTIDEVALAMGISTATAVRSWRYARAWLAEKLAETVGD